MMTYILTYRFGCIRCLVLHRRTAASLHRRRCVRLSSLRLPDCVRGVRRRAHQHVHRVKHVVDSRDGCQSVRRYMSSSTRPADHRPHLRHVDVRRSIRNQRPRQRPALPASADRRHSVPRGRSLLLRRRRLVDSSQELGAHLPVDVLRRLYHDATSGL